MPRRDLGPLSTLTCIWRVMHGSRGDGPIGMPPAMDADAPRSTSVPRTQEGKQRLIVDQDLLNRSPGDLLLSLEADHFSRGGKFERFFVIITVSGAQQDAIDDGGVMRSFVSNLLGNLLKQQDLAQQLRDVRHQISAASRQMARHDGDPVAKSRRTIPAELSRQADSLERACSALGPQRLTLTKQEGGWLPQLTMKDPTCEARDCLRALGSLFAMCLTERGNDWLRIGQLFCLETFAAMLRFSCNDLLARTTDGPAGLRSFTDLSQERLGQLALAAIPRAVDLELEELIEYAQCATNHAAFYLAQGLARFEEDRGRRWQDCVALGATGLMERIQGKLDADAIRNAIEWILVPDQLKAMCEAWLQAQDMPGLRGFLQLVTGSEGLGGRKITITTSQQKGPREAPTISTCATTLTLPCYETREQLDQGMEMALANGLSALGAYGRR